MLKLRILNEGNVDILSLFLHPSRRQQCKYRTLDGAHFIPKLLAMAVTSPCRVTVVIWGDCPLPRAVS